MTLRSSLLIAALWLAGTQANFDNPWYTTPYGPGKYQNTRVWQVGEVQEIKFGTSDIQDFESYTIALWQQHPDGSGGGADRGPTISEGDVPDSEIVFNWTVSLYEFHLSYSNVFFLWLWDGNNQGNMDFKQVASSYFNITDGTDEFAPSSSSTAETTTLSSATSAAPPSVGETTAGTTTIETSTPPTSTNGISEPKPEDRGLSTGAGIGIGIGVGAGVLGVCGVICTWLLVRHRRRKREAAMDQRPSTMVPIQGHGMGGAYDSVPYSDMTHTASYQKQEVPGVGPGEPVMLDSRPPAELDGRGVTVT